MYEEGRDVSSASGNPNPKKYGQLFSIYDSLLWTSQPGEKNTQNNPINIVKYISKTHPIQKYQNIIQENKSFTKNFQWFIMVYTLFIAAH